MQLQKDNQELQTQLNLAQQEIGRLKADLNSCIQEKAQLQADVAALRTENASLKTENAQLRSQLQLLQDQLEAAKAEIVMLMQANQTLSNIISNVITTIERDFQQEFRDSDFKIPGGTPLEQLQNFTTTILNLNRGHKTGVYRDLGGKK